MPLFGQCPNRGIKQGYFQTKHVQWTCLGGTESFTSLIKVLCPDELSSSELQPNNFKLMAFFANSYYPLMS